VCKVIRVAAADAGLTVTFSLSNGRFPVVLWCAVGAGGGFRAGLLCVAGSGNFEKLLRSDLLAVVVGGGTALD
jgi:hypothetical protein